MEGEKINSCIWNVIATLKDKVRPYVFHKIGNGSSTSVWNAARWENNMIVADMIQDGRWQWPNGCSQIFPELLNIDVPVLQECVKDKILWKIQNGKLFIFSAKTTWEDLRCRGQNVKWNNMVWYSQRFPRQPFILWLAVKEKLHTPDDDVEFKQEYDMNLDTLKRKMKAVNLDNELRNIVEKLDNMPCTNNIRIVVRKFVISTCVYFIWRERNARLFTNEKKNVKGLIKEIDENMKIQLKNIKTFCDPSLRMMRFWDVYFVPSSENGADTSVTGALAKGNVVWILRISIESLEGFGRTHSMVMPS
ncbi:hypothetical protein Tco_0872243 [Tanacetum coccineum]